MERVKIKIKRVQADEESCIGCMFNAGGDCRMPHCADVMYDVEIDEGDTLPPFRCIDARNDKGYIYVEK